MRMAKISCPPQSGRVGDLVYVASSRYGQIVRKFVPPSNPRTPSQQNNRSRFSGVVSSWRGLEPAQRLAWCLSATENRLRLNGYNYYIQVNARRAHLDLSLFTLPPDPAPSVGPNPVAELAITNNGGQVSLKVRVPSAPAQVHAGARGCPGQRRGALRGALPLPGIAARARQRLERHYRALCGPVWGAARRQRGVYPHLPAGGRLGGPAEGHQRPRSGRVSRPASLLPASSGAGAIGGSRRRGISHVLAARQRLAGCGQAVLPGPLGRLGAR